MKATTFLYILLLPCLIYSADSESFFKMGVNGSLGMSIGHIEADKTMQYFFKPTSDITYKKAVLPGLGLDFYLGKYFAISSGITYLQTGQTTSESIVYFEDSEFSHQFKANALLNYLEVPFLVKGGIQFHKFSAYARAGLIPCYLIDKDVNWIIDGRAVDPGSHMPNVSIKSYDILGTIGVECGMYFGNNGIFVTGDYNISTESIADGLDGSAKNKFFSVGIKYSRLTIK